MNEIVREAEMALKRAMPSFNFYRPINAQGYRLVIAFDEFYLDKVISDDLAKQPGLLAKLTTKWIDEFFEIRLKKLAEPSGVVRRTTENASDLSEP